MDLADISDLNSVHFPYVSTQGSAGIPLDDKKECARSHFISAAFLIVVCTYIYIYIYMKNMYIEGKQLHKVSASHTACLFV